jgi:hypothetical protein
MTNTGEKPIYFVYIMMGTNVKHEGIEIMYPLSYGRAQLGDILTKPFSDDIPINPGETHIFKLGEVPYWEKGVREKLWPESTKFTAEIQVLSFGDGTGYFGTQLYPPAERRQATVNEKMPRASSARARPHERLSRTLGTQSKSSSTFKQPTLMSANFLSSAFFNRLIATSNANFLTLKRKCSLTALLLLGCSLYSRRRRTTHQTASRQE